MTTAFWSREQLEEIGAKATIVIEPARRDSGAAVGDRRRDRRGARSADRRRGLRRRPCRARPEGFPRRLRHRRRSRRGEGAIVTLGVTPTEPATGYGYIRPGEPLGGRRRAPRRRLRREARPRNRQALRSGRLSVEFGQLLLPRRRDADELRAFEPEMAEATAAALAAASDDLGFLMLDKAAFERSPKKSIDYAVMERTHRAAVVPADVGWSDVGNWDAVWKLEPARRQRQRHPRQRLRLGVKERPYPFGRPADGGGRRRRRHGGVDPGRGAGLAGATRATRSRTSSTRSSSTSGREATEHKRIYRPWGYYQSIDSGPRYQVKRIVVSPGRQLSLQKHFHRAEHWVVVKGTAQVTRGAEDLVVHENEFDLPAARRRSPPGQSGQDRPRTDRGADRLLSRRGRHRPPRGRLPSPVEGLNRRRDCPLPARGERGRSYAAALAAARP